MLYNKVAAIAAIAIMLVAAPFMGGLLLPPTLAQSVHVAEKTFERDSEETTTIDSVSFDAMQESLRSNGELIVKIIQDGEEMSSTSISANGISAQNFVRVTAEFDADVSVTDDFTVVIEYTGAAPIAVRSSSIEVNDDGVTDTAGGQDNNGETTTSEDTNTRDLNDDDLENVVARETISQPSDQKMEVDAVEFRAIEQSLRTSGTIIVAIVQGNQILDSEGISTDETNVRSATDLEADFDLDVTGTFEVVVMYEGSGIIVVSDIDVLGPTSPAESGGSNGGNGSDDGNGKTDESPNVILTVEAEDEEGNPLDGMFITVFQDMNPIVTNFTTAVFNLPDGNYTVRAHDFDDESTNTHIHFVEWKDSVKGQFRFADLTNEDSETFTAVYSVDGSTGTAGGDTNTGTNNTNTGGTNDGDTNTGDTNTGSDTNTGGSGDLTVEAGQVGVRSVLLDGTEAPGFQVQLRDTNGDILETKFTPAVFDNVEPGQRIVMYSAGNTYFRSWSDNGLHRYHVVEADDLGTVLTTRYENVPADQDAHLVVIARTADGEVIGGTTGTETDGTLSATPGLEVTVAPPGTMTPYTAGFTGGSEISEHFFFFDGQTYTIVIQEYPPYTFSHWEDNPSFTNRARVVNLNGDTTLVAIFNEN